MNEQESSTNFECNGTKQPQTRKAAINQHLCPHVMPTRTNVFYALRRQEFGQIGLTICFEWINETEQTIYSRRLHTVERERDRLGREYPDVDEHPEIDLLRHFVTQAHWDYWHVQHFSFCELKRCAICSELLDLGILERTGRQAV